MTENGVHADVLFGGCGRIGFVRFASFIGARWFMVIEIIFVVSLLLVVHVACCPLS